MIARKWRIVIITGLMAIAGVIYALSLPRQYTARTEIVVEKQVSSGTSGTIGMLGGLAGLNPGGENVGITIELAPAIIRSVPFLLEFENARIELFNPPKDAPDTLTLINYLQQYQRGLFSVVKKPKSSDEIPVETSTTPYTLSEKQRLFTQAAYNIFGVRTEKMSNVMVLTATTQDPLASVILVDSLARKIQHYLTKYQTGKAQQELAQSIIVAEATRDRYYNAQEIYAAARDQHQNLIMMLGARAEQERLENDMKVALNSYISAAGQVEIAQIKLLENTPVYTILNPPLLDVSASYPNRKLIVVVSFMFGLFISIGTVLFKDIWMALTSAEQNNE